MKLDAEILRLATVCQKVTELLLLTITESGYLVESRIRTYDLCSAAWLFSTNKSVQTYFVRTFINVSKTSKIVTTSN